jgi:hypothetical protein
VAGGRSARAHRRRVRRGLNGVTPVQPAGLALRIIVVDTRSVVRLRVAVPGLFRMFRAREPHRQWNGSVFHGTFRGAQPRSAGNRVVREMPTSFRGRCSTARSAARLRAARGSTHARVPRLPDERPGCGVVVRVLVPDRSALFRPRCRTGGGDDVGCAIRRVSPLVTVTRDATVALPATARCIGGRNACPAVTRRPRSRAQRLSRTELHAWRGCPWHLPAAPVCPLSGRAATSRRSDVGPAQRRQWLSTVTRNGNRSGSW